MQQMDEPEEFISKTRRKKEMRQLQDVGAALVELSREQLARIDMPDNLREAVTACQSITKHEARRRQIQWIGKLMRHVDAAPIAEQLAGLEAPTKKQNALFHLAEKWRDDLIGDPLAMGRFEREFPHAQLHRIRQLLEATRVERAANRAPKHLRELFHAVNAVVQEAAKQ
jgi:ribosome-associated protein